MDTLDESMVSEWCLNQSININSEFRCEIHPEHGPLEVNFPLQPSGCQVPCGSLPGCHANPFFIQVACSKISILFWCCLRALRASPPQTRKRWDRPKTERGPSRVKADTPSPSETDIASADAVSKSEDVERRVCRQGRRLILKNSGRWLFLSPHKDLHLLDAFGIGRFTYRQTSCGWTVPVPLSARAVPSEHHDVPS